MVTVIIRLSVTVLELVWQNTVLSSKTSFFVILGMADLNEHWISACQSKAQARGEPCTPVAFKWSVSYLPHRLLLELCSRTRHDWCQSSLDAVHSTALDNVLQQLENANGYEEDAKKYWDELERILATSSAVRIYYTFFVCVPCSELVL